MSSPIAFEEYAHLKIPFQDIASATNNFADENLVGKGGFGNVYKGQLTSSGEQVQIVAKRLHSSYDEPSQGNAEFRTEISMLSHIEHRNIVSFVGYCDDGGEKIIINKYQVNGSLDKYLSDPTQLTWMQRLHICVDVARALSYIHYDTRHTYTLIHRNIKSSKILLDENWDARLSGFGFSTSTRRDRHRLFLARVCGTYGYVDPVYAKTGGVNQKSDVYSFGVVLFEVLCGKNAVIFDEDGTASQLLAPLARKHYEDEKLDEMIDPDLKKQMDPESFTSFSQTAYQCLNRDRAQRPNMENVLKRLEKVLQLQWKHENPEHSKTVVEGTSSNHLLKGKHLEHLEHLKIQLKDIVLATGNFAATYRVGSGTYGTVYRAELDHFDSKSSSAIEGDIKDELPKKHNCVAIKKISSRQDEKGEQGFFAEVEMLTRCKHQNIVSLLGFCNEESQQILVYEFASNGSLDDYLRNTDKMTTLTWKQLINVCLDIANGLNYLHTKERIIHRDIKSANILLYKNWEAKIADFGLSKFHRVGTHRTTNVAGTDLYLDPEYQKTGKLKKESDIYSFGVVMFEILCGRLAYDAIYNTGNDRGLPSIVRRRFREGIFMEMVDPKIKEETDENIFTLNKGPNKNSLDTFSKIAYQCLAETHAARPTMEAVIKELKNALIFQENNKDSLKIPFEDIKLATQNFSDSNCIGKGGFGTTYKGEVPHGNRFAAKRLERTYGQGEHEFLMELEILFEYRHENFIGLVGYCDEMDEKIIVYEYASRGSLDKYLGYDGLTWIKRLSICIDVARGLDFLHANTDVKQDVVIHRDIKSANILLNANWEAKIADFGLSLVGSIYQESDYIIENVVGTPGYVDPLYIEAGVLSKKTDIYSYGVVLFEILCGRLAYGPSKIQTNLVKQMFEEGRFEEMVFDGIKEQIVAESLTAYSSIAYQCLQRDREKRPTAGEVMVQLKQALELQEDYEIWEPKLPADYKQIIQMSGSPESYSHRMKKDLYTIFSKGILLKKDEVWFSLGNKGERNEMISARKFSYKNRATHKWRSVPESRFKKVAELLDISNLKIQIKIRTQFLSPCVNYGAHLVFRFYGPRKSLAKQMYVNLKYKKGNETLHAYFATWREDGWMMIELCRFYNHKKDTDFEVLLESFSQCYCGSRAVYFEGIEFQAIDNEKHEEIEKSEEVQVLEPNSPSDYEGVIELQRQQVFHIKRRIKSQNLSPNTENVCYLVFRLAEKCHGLHCPVIVRDLLHWRNKKVGILYFRSPNPWNLHDTDWVPKKRKDGWMEVIVWKFNSNYKLKDGCLFVNLKLISYEGTMAGLMIRDLELRPI